MAAKKPQIRLNNDIKKAVHSGNGYEDYMTVYQFLKCKQDMLTRALRRIKHRMEDFYYDGGEVFQEDDSTFHASRAGVDLRIVYDGEGDVTEYTVTGIKKKSHVAERILYQFLDELFVPFFENAIAVTEEQLKNLDNDNTLRGLCELRDLIRKDTYLTTAAISGLDIMSEEYRDNLIGLMEDDE